MTITITPKIALAALLSGSALLFALGASNQNDSGNPRWTISAAPGEDAGLYALDQNSGELYLVRVNPNIGGRDLKIKRLGNINEAK